uniref:MARVEL domain-containing protein n=1 Tax=Panagrellus redivivus TaxID=6233 RepID=A0A7E4VI99_PANRE
MYKRGHPMDRGYGTAVAAYPSKDGCISRVPYSSVMAFVMCTIGVIMFAIMMIWSFNASVEQARRALDIVDIPYLSRVHLAFIVVAVVMEVLALFLLLIGVLSTGSTREEVYKRPESRRGGRISCAIAIVVSYVLLILWLLVLASTAIISFKYFEFAKLCSSLSTYSEQSCLDFSGYKPLFEDISKSNLKLCGGNAQEFCALTNTVFSWNIVGFVGSFIICLGLVQFVSTHASNYAHVSSEQRYIELKEVLYVDGRPPQPPPPMLPPIPRAPPPADPRFQIRPDRRGVSHDSLARRQQRHQHSRSLHGSNPWLNDDFDNGFHRQY